MNGVVHFDFPMLSGTLLSPPVTRDPLEMALTGPQGKTAYLMAFVPQFGKSRVLKCPHLSTNIVGDG